MKVKVKVIKAEASTQSRIKRPTLTRKKVIVTSKTVSVQKVHLTRAKPQFHLQPVTGPSFKNSGFNRILRSSTAFVWKAAAASLVAILVLVPALKAFEAHIINVTAEVAQIDPPVLTIPGDIGWDKLEGGNDLTGEQIIEMTDLDPDATHIFYTFGPGTDPNLVHDPVCGQTGPNGGGAEKIETELLQLTLTSDTVIKAIACNGSSGSAEHSVVNTKVYRFGSLEPCELKQVDFPANLAVLAAGDKVLADSIIASANIVIDGDAHSNYKILASGSGSNRDINGNASAGQDIMVNNFNISGTVTTGTPPSVLPDIHLASLKAEAAAGGSVNGSFVFPNNTTGIALGPTEVLGNVSFGSGNSMTLKGILYIHGNLSIGSNTTITEDPSFTDQFAVIIVDGTIDIDANVSFVGAGSLGRFLLVSTSAPKPGNDAAIETSSNNSDLGDVVLYASEGDVHINSNRTLLAIFARHGTAGTNPAIDLDSNVTVHYSPLPLVIGCGAEFTPISQILINEFVPNVEGSDQGVAGGSLDGEWVELYNGGASDTDVNTWALYDSDDDGELLITPANVEGGNTVIPPGGHLVVFRDGNSDFDLNNRNDTLRLYNASIGLGGVLIDSHVYDYGGNIPVGKSFARTPDGTANWIDPDATPGEPNIEYINPDIQAFEPVVFESEEEEVFVEEEAPQEQPAEQAIESSAPTAENTESNFTISAESSRGGGTGGSSTTEASSSSSSETSSSEATQEEQADVPAPDPADQTEQEEAAKPEVILPEETPPPAPETQEPPAETVPPAEEAPKAESPPPATEPPAALPPAPAPDAPASN